jgi:AcrR family transcriptional regulator
MARGRLAADGLRRQPVARRGAGERAGLTRARVLDSALGLADRHGGAALSMRKLAAELGVEAMTLYHYVPSKEALLDGLVERVLELSALPQAGDQPWPAALQDYAETLRATLLRHPGVLPLALTRPAATPQSLRAAESGLRVLTDAGFSLGAALDLLNALTIFVVGHAAAEVGTAKVHQARAPGSTAALAGLDAAEYPLLTEAARTGQGTDDQHRFRAAVSALLAGYAAFLA